MNQKCLQTAKFTVFPKTINKIDDIYSLGCKEGLTKVMKIVKITKFTKTVKFTIFRKTMDKMYDIYSLGCKEGLTKVTEVAKLHLCPGLNAVTNFTNLTIFCLSFKFNKFCDFSFNSTRFTKIRCLNDFSAHGEIYNFMLIHQQAPACGFYKIDKICDFLLTLRFSLSHCQIRIFFVLLCNANSTYQCWLVDFTKFAIFCN